MITAFFIAFCSLISFFLRATSAEQSCRVEVKIEKPTVQHTTQLLEYGKPRTIPRYGWIPFSAHAVAVESFEVGFWRAAFYPRGCGEYEAKEKIYIRVWLVKYLLLLRWNQNYAHSLLTESLSYENITTRDKDLYGGADEEGKYLSVDHLLESEQSFNAVGRYARVDSTHNATLAINGTKVGGAQQHWVVAVNVCNIEFCFFVEGLNYFGYWMSNINSK